MRTYTIDQLDEAEVRTLAERLSDMNLQAGLEGVFWLPVPAGHLTPIQREHENTCGPYCMALETEENSIHMELLVRAQGRIRCDCLSFASLDLRNHMIAYLETQLSELGISF